jgi:kumamolisin
MDIARKTLPGSGRSVLAGALPGTALDPSTRIEVTLVLRRRAEPVAAAFTAAPLSPAELAQTYGADPVDVATVERELAAAGVQVLAVDAASRRVRAAGTVAALSELFGTSLRAAEVEGVAVRHRSGELSVPAGLADVVIAVLGLDDRPQARTRYRVASRRSPATSYTPPQLATIYSMPPDTDGSGQAVAIIELGGGYRQADLQTYFAGLGLSTPSVTSVGVDGGSNGGGTDPNGADAEVLLDIEVAGALAPKATYTVYFAPNTDDGFLDAVSTAAHADPGPTAISISWGGSEDSWTAQARNAMDQAFADAALLGATVTVAAGDNGSSDSSGSSAAAGGGAVHVDFPASSPHALACGGTSLDADVTTGAVRGERVWNDGTSGGATGGGVSDAFPVPSWQATAGVPHRSGTERSGRGVPDVAAVADPQTGYQVLVDGTATVVGGTSAVAPLWAALICRLAQASGKRFGLLQPLLYAHAEPGVSPPGLRDITSGDNGAYSAGPGWDACTGLGVPDGAALLTLLSGIRPVDETR